MADENKIAIDKNAVQNKVAKILLSLDKPGFKLDDQMQQLYALQQVAATHIADNKLTCELQVLTGAYAAIKTFLQAEIDNSPWRDSIPQATEITPNSEKHQEEKDPKEKIQKIIDFTKYAIVSAQKDDKMTKVEPGILYKGSKTFKPSQKPRDFIAGCLHAINEIACGEDNKKLKENFKLITSTIQNFRGANEYAQMLLNLPNDDDNNELSMTPSSHSLGNNGQKGSMKEDKNGNKLTPNVYDITFINANASMKNVTRSANLIHPDLKINEQKAFFESSVNTIVAKSTDKVTNADVNSGNSETKQLIEKKKPFLVYQTLVDPNVAFGKDNEAILARRKRKFASGMKDTDVICTNYSINQNGQPRGIFQSGFSFLINLTTTIPLQQLGDIFGKNGSGLSNLFNPAVWFPQISNDISNLNAQNKIIEKAKLIESKENNKNVFEIIGQSGTSIKGENTLNLYKRERTKMALRSIFSNLPIIGFMAQIGTHNLRTAALEAILVGKMANKDHEVFFDSSCKSGKDREAIIWASALALLNDPSLKGDSLLDATCKKYFDLRDNARVIAGVSEGTVANKVLEETFGKDRIERHCTHYDFKKQTANAKCNKTIPNDEPYQAGDGHKSFQDQVVKLNTQDMHKNALERLKKSAENDMNIAELVNNAPSLK